MQPSAPEQREALFRANAVMRWLAMSIVAVPEESRAAQYLTVRRNMADAVQQFGMSGNDAEAYLNKKMDEIRDLVREIEAALDPQAEQEPASLSFG